MSDELLAEILFDMDAGKCYAHLAIYGALREVMEHRAMLAQIRWHVESGMTSTDASKVKALLFIQAAFEKWDKGAVGAETPP